MHYAGSRILDQHSHQANDIRSPARLMIVRCSNSLSLFRTPGSPVTDILIDCEQFPVERRMMRFTQRQHVRHISPILGELTPRQHVCNIQQTRMVDTRHWAFLIVPGQHGRSGTQDRLSEHGSSFRTSRLSPHYLTLSTVRRPPTFRPRT